MKENLKKDFFNNFKLLIANFALLISNFIPQSSADEFLFVQFSAYQ